MGRLNDFIVGKLSERSFDPGKLDFSELENETTELLRSWGVPYDRPRRVEYHESQIENARGNTIGAFFSPWADRIDIALRNQIGTVDIIESSIEENLHKAQYDFFLGDTTSEQDEVAAMLEQNFEDFRDTIERPLESGVLDSPHWRPMETRQDILIAALPEVGEEYDEIVEESGKGVLGTIAKPRMIRSEVQERLDRNRDQLEEVAAPVLERYDGYIDVYHVQPVAEAFADIATAHIRGDIGSTSSNLLQSHQSKKYPVDGISKIYSELVDEYESFDGEPEEKISHVMSLMPEYLEEHHKNSELRELEPEQIRKY